MSDSLPGDPLSAAARKPPRRATWKQMLITLACGLLFTLGGFLGFAETCSFEGGQRPINQVFACVALIGVAVTILGLLWGAAEFVLFAVRRYKDSGL